jgi:hypothetical protein
MDKKKSRNHPLLLFIGRPPDILVCLLCQKLDIFMCPANCLSVDSQHPNTFIFIFLAHMTFGGQPTFDTIIVVNSPKFDFLSIIN